MATMLTPRVDFGARPCDPATQATGLERTRYFARQLVGPDDLTQDQIYFREKHRRHNRMLHGWGVVCGACVRRRSECEVVVEPGYVLGPWGDEIVIDREVVIDVCKQGVGETTGCCGDDVDPWCRDTRADCPEGPLYLAVRHAECDSRPVRAPGGGCGCGCDEGACEYSRVRDSYAIRLLRELPAPYTTPMAQPAFTALQPCANRVARPCPPCPPEPWVILADVLVGRDCKVRSVDCFAHRRYVVSFADFYLTCPPRAGGVLVPTNRIATLAASRTMAMMSGSADLVDARGALSGEAPRATVMLMRDDGTRAAVPAYFDVRAGETVRELLAREGDRELYDPATDATVTLRALYEGASVAPDTRLAGVASALAALEGRPLRTTARAAAPTEAPAAPATPAPPARGAEGAEGAAREAEPRRGAPPPEEGPYREPGGGGEGEEGEPRRRGRRRR